LEYLINAALIPTYLLQLNIRQVLTHSGEESVLSGTGAGAAVIYTINTDNRTSTMSHSELASWPLAELRGLQPKVKLLTPVHELEDV
jgi:hypothetical protein